MPLAINTQLRLVTRRWGGGASPRRAERPRLAAARSPRVGERGILELEVNRRWAAPDARVWRQRDVARGDVGEVHAGRRVHVATGRSIIGVDDPYCVEIAERTTHPALQRISVEHEVGDGVYVKDETLHQMQAGEEVLHHT